MNTTVNQINEYIETSCSAIKYLYDVVAQSDEYHDYPLKGMVDSLDPETEPPETLNDIHELMGFINGFRLAWHMREWQKDEAAETQILKGGVSDVTENENITSVSKGI